MIRYLCLFILLLCGLTMVKVWAYEQAVDQATGATDRVYLPETMPWNGDLIIYAQGFVAPTPTPYIPENQLVLPNGTSVPSMITSLGYAFAVTSFRTNGLNIKYGVDDLRRLKAYFISLHGIPHTTYLVGISEGGLITALALEQQAGVFDGGLALCAPVGDFRRQLDYMLDFRVVFDYFFPGLLPGSALAIPPAVMAGWEIIYAPRILAAVAAQPYATAQLLQVTKVPVDPHKSDSAGKIIVHLLWYNVFATNDAVAKLGGNPYDNRQRWYSGSMNDLKLNQGVRRYIADPNALAEIARYYQTSGHLCAPLITMHATGDPTVPYWHETSYSERCITAHAAFQRINMPVTCFGHVNFRTCNLANAFMALIERMSAPFVARTEVASQSEDQRKRAVSSP